MPRRTSRSTAQARVLKTLTPAEMPADPFGPGGYSLEMDDSHLMPGSGNVQRYSGPKRERLSDAPNFKYTQMVDAPILNRQTGAISMGRKMQFNLDPEKHIERTSRTPGATGMTGAHESGTTSERAAAGMMGEPVPGYGGSTDARVEGSLEHRTTRRVWNQKKREAAQPKGATERRRGVFGMRDVKVHGAGLFDALMSGESVRSPAHLIIDPAAPKYGPRIDSYNQIDEGDSGGFGHDQPVQWQGHHRVAAAAMKQKALRESGAKDWSVPVPYEMHIGTDAVSGTDMALSHSHLMHASEDITEKRHSRKKALAQMFAGNRGTWNPKAY